MIDSRRDAPSGNVLEDTLESWEVMPLHFKRNCKMIRELDVHSTARSASLVFPSKYGPKSMMGIGPAACEGAQVDRLVSRT